MHLPLSSDVFGTEYIVTENKKNMNEKNTTELNNILGKTHVRDFSRYCEENQDSMIGDANSFQVYMRECFHEKGLTQQRVFLLADIPERYGYKIMSGEKHTQQRDVILRICYAAELSLDETQRALEKYGLPILYAKVPRDALIMILFQNHPGSIIDVNTILKEHGMEPLRSSGVQD